MTTYGLRCDAGARRAERKHRLAVRRARVLGECLAFVAVLTIALAAGFAAVLIGEAGW